MRKDSNAEWISTTDKLFSNKEISVFEAVQTLLVCLLNLAVEQGVPIPDTTPAPGKCMGGEAPVSSAPAFSAPTKEQPVDLSPVIQPSEPDQNGGSYLQAASVNTATIQHPSATMPTITIGFMGKDGAPMDFTRQAHLNTGCNCNLMSKHALQRDLKFLGPNAVVKNIKPFPISMADGMCQSVCSQILTGGKIVVGHATYEMSCLIVDKLAVDYLIGMAWQLMYDLQLKPKQSLVSLGVTQDAWFHPRRKYQSYLTVKAALATKHLTLIETI